MIHVCDCLMGSGKTESAINYINSHPEDRFIYITPYLSEASRIKSGCPDMDFVEPSNKKSKYDFKKTLHTAALIKDRRNIATTHQAFKGYTSDMLEDIRAAGYILIIDENVEVLEKFDCHSDDLRIAVDAGYVVENNGVYSTSGREYNGRMFSELFSMLQSRELIHVSNEGDAEYFYWALPPSLVTSFKEVFVLTYMFRGQSIHHFFEINHLDYEYIGVERTDDGGYRFGPYPGYIPDYVYDLKNKIHIIDQSKLNDVGDDYYALSKRWFERGGAGVDQLKRNVINCYNNIWRDVPANRKLWGSYKGAYSQIKGKGYSRSFLTFNTKATNEFRNRDSLVYVANPFMNVGEKTFYQMHGIDVDEDAYALSIAIQWIWRSAIRDGGDVYLYIPSRRMRTLLSKWIESVCSKGEISDV